MASRENNGSVYRNHIIACSIQIGCNVFCLPAGKLQVNNVRCHRQSVT